MPVTHNYPTQRLSTESSGVECEVSHRVLHFRADDKFGQEGFVFASEYVAQRVYEKRCRNFVSRVEQLLAASAGQPSLAALRGKSFEQHAHSVLSQGGEFQAQRLIEGHKGSVAGALRDNFASISGRVHLPRRKIVAFNEDGEVSNYNNVMNMQPVSSNFMSVDAMAKPNELFQMTVALVHPCKQEELRKALNMLGNPVQPRLYFVAPTDVFSEFKYQDDLNSQSVKVKKAPHNVRKLEQYVITFKFDFNRAVCERCRIVILVY